MSLCTTYHLISNYVLKYHGHDDHFLSPGCPSSNSDDIDYVPSTFAFTKPPKASTSARDARIERRHALQQTKSEEKDTTEHNETELEQMELDIDEGLLMTTIPKSVVVQREAMVTTDASQQTEIHGRGIQTQTTQAILRPYPQELEHEVSLTMVSASHTISAASLKENDVKIKFCTGRSSTCYDCLSSLHAQD